MFEYMRTVLNGLKAWVTGEVNKLLSKIDAVGAVARRASNTATKNKNSIGVLRGSLDNVTTTAEVAQNVAYTARNTAQTAQSTAETAQSTAETAKTIANTCIRAHGWPSNADTDKEVTYWMRNDRSNKNVHVYIGNAGGSALEIHVGEETVPSVTFIPPCYGGAQANFEFSRVAPGYHHPLITGIGGVVMYSSDGNSTKKFKITVDDTGTLKATEVTT